MSKFDAFIEKINSDEALTERAKEAGQDAGAVAALAAELGFELTKEEVESMQAEGLEPSFGELSEDQLDNVAGGATQNRFDSSRCWGAKKVIYECVGFLKAVHCDHYVCVPTGKTIFLNNYHQKIYVHKCNMGCFDYEARVNG